MLNCYTQCIHCPHIVHAKHCVHCTKSTACTVQRILHCIHLNSLKKGNILQWGRMVNSILTTILPFWPSASSLKGRWHFLDGIFFGSSRRSFSKKFAYLKNCLDILKKNGESCFSLSLMKRVLKYKTVFDTNRIDIITVYYCVNRFLITIGDFK